MTAYKASRHDMPAISQPMPLNDFPAFAPRVAAARPLTPSEAAQLVHREDVRDRRKVWRKAWFGRYGRTAVIAAAIAVLSLPTVERWVLHPEDAINAAAMHSQA